jgi:hypothetical protein
MKVVGTLTTMPHRYIDNDKLLNTLKSLNNQTYKLDKIYLGLPHRCERLNIDYPEVPDEIKNLCDIIRCPDYGPITKIVPALLMEDDPKTIIISFDDDIEYPKSLVENLIKKHKLHSNSAIGSSGILLKNLLPNCAIYLNNKWANMCNFKVPSNGRRVDSIYGFSGVLYLRKFFPDKEKIYDEFIKYALIDENIRMNDDISISGYLSMKNIKRRIFSDFDIIHLHADVNKNDISADGFKFISRLNLSIITAKSIGMYKNTEEVYFSETILFKIFIFLFGILFIIVLLFQNCYINNIYEQYIENCMKIYL